MSDQSAAPHLSKRNFVKDGDLRILTAVGILAMSVLIIFGAAVYWSGILDFPAMPQDTEGRDYVGDSLIYRERRMALALVMRTFLTGFSFVVGLALCTMGGLFILRQVSSLSTLSGNLGGRMGLLAEDAAPKEVADRLQRTQFSFSSYSPGVMFMLGGVTIMVVTQLLAIPVRAVEIVPQGAAALCVDPETGNHVGCSATEAPSDALPGPGEQTALRVDPGASQTAMMGSDAQTVTGTTQMAPTSRGPGDDDGSAQDGFATSTAIVELAPPEDDRAGVSPIAIYPDLAAYDAVTLPDGYAIVAVAPDEIVVEGEGRRMVFQGWELDFAAPDWGIVIE